jgi:hypothetical protein
MEWNGMEWSWWIVLECWSVGVEYEYGDKRVERGNGNEKGPFL